MKQQTRMILLIAMMMTSFPGPTFSCALSGSAREAGSGWPAQWETLGRMVSALQSRSGIHRDHCSYRQTLSLIRLEKQGGSGKEASLSTRRYILETAPNARGEVTVRTESALDGENHALTGDQSTPGILSSARFWEELFFPFFPEKIKRYDILEIEDIQEGDTRAMSIHFMTREDGKEGPIMEGYAFVSPRGEMLRLVWKEVRSLEIFDPILAGWTISNLTVTFRSSEEEGVQLPQSANMEFTARNKPWKGFYRLRYQETGHQTGNAADSGQ